MATYGIAVYKNFQSATDEAQRTLIEAGFEVFDNDGVQIFVDMAKAIEACQVLEKAGFETDEDDQ